MNMEKSFPYISQSVLEKLVVQYHHRLLSLEAELKDRAKNGSISAKCFSRSVSQIKNVYEDLQALEKIAYAKKSGKLTAIDIGLPAFEECSISENQMLAKFLKEREEDLSDLFTELKKIYQWLYSATQKPMNPIQAVLRLSKLRRLIALYDERALKLKDEDLAIDAQIHLFSLQIEENSKDGMGLLQGLIAMFHRLEMQLTRVAKLKKMVNREELKIKKMEESLSNIGDHKAHPYPSTPPPTPLVTAQAAQRIAQIFAKEREQNKTRSHIVLRYWQSVVAQAPGKIKKSKKKG